MTAAGHRGAIVVVANGKAGEMDPAATAAGERGGSIVVASIGKKRRIPWQWQ